MSFVAYRGKKSLAKQFAKEVIETNKIELEGDANASFAPDDVLSLRINKVQISDKAKLLSELSLAASMGVP